MKQCNRCRIEKTIEDFSWRDKKNGIRQYHCKACNIAMSKAHYKEKPEAYKARGKESAKRTKIKHVAIANGVKLQYGCQVCPETHIAVLDFHHKEAESKDAAIGNMIISSGTEKLLQEMRKCIILCSNCHRKYHYGDLEIVSIVENTPTLQVAG